VHVRYTRERNSVSDFISDYRMPCSVHVVYVERSLAHANALAKSYPLFHAFRSKSTRSTSCTFTIISIFKIKNDIDDLKQQRIAQTTNRNPTIISRFVVLGSWWPVHAVRPFRSSHTCCLFTALKKQHSTHAHRHLCELKPTTNQPLSQLASRQQL
jgi:hypothetical protein